jgi:hypothetical protein
MRAKPRKYKGFGTIAGVKRVLWQILQRAGERVNDATADDEGRRGWANTGIQAALAYAKIHETHAIEQEMHGYEHLLNGQRNGHHS